MYIYNKNYHNEYRSIRRECKIWNIPVKEWCLEENLKTIFSPKLKRKVSFKLKKKENRIKT